MREREKERERERERERKWGVFLEAAPDGTRVFRDPRNGSVSLYNRSRIIAASRSRKLVEE
jgi:hypothetical protein